MWLKFINLVGLVGATVWLSRAPDWEPAIAVATLFLTLVGLEWHDHRSHKAVPDSQVEHDLKLFRRYDEMMSESRLRDELNGSLYNRRTTTHFTDRLRRVVELSGLQEGSYIDPDLEAAFRAFITEAAALRDFIGRHFFTLNEPPEPDGNRPLMLYPDLRHAQDEKADYYEERVTELGALAEQVEEAYLLFRKEAKRVLST
jgi:hypothetical protein